MSNADFRWLSYESVCFKAIQLILLLLLIIIIYLPIFVTRNQNLYLNNQIECFIFASRIRLHLKWLCLVNFPHLYLFRCLNELKLECLKISEHEDNVIQIAYIGYYRTSSTIKKRQQNVKQLNPQFSNSVSICAFGCIVHWYFEFHSSQFIIIILFIKLWITIDYDEDFLVGLVCGL